MQRKVLGRFLIQVHEMLKVLWETAQMSTNKHFNFWTVMDDNIGTGHNTRRKKTAQKLETNKKLTIIVGAIGHAMVTMVI